MDAVTYPKEALIDFMNQNVIPLRLGSDEQPMASEFGIKWTPSLLILDENGDEHHRTVGFFEAKELIPSILIGMGKTHFDAGEFKKALSCFDKILADYSASDFAPETIFLSGVSNYKDTGAPAPLKQAYEHLQEKYPASPWTKRAYPYRLIE